MPDPYISEVKYLGGATLDFVEIAVDAGTDVSDLTVTIYNANGSVRSTNSLSGLTYTTIAGRDVYVVETGSPSTFSGLHKFGGVALSDTTSVYQFVSFSDNAATITATGGAASGLTSTDIGQAGSGNSLETSDGGATYTVQTSPNSGTIPCLTNGTLVETKSGLVPVERLMAGMKVRTIDGSFKTLRLVVSREISKHDLENDPRLHPVRIMSGALGLGLPKRDLLVSRQHRMLINSPICKRMFNSDSALVAAIRLTELPGIFVDEQVQNVEYFHLVFDEHCVILAEGAPTESFLLGPEIKQTLPDPVVEELQRLFPDMIKAVRHPIPARPIPSRKRQKRLIARHLKNARPLLNSIQRNTAIGICA